MAIAGFNLSEKVHDVNDVHIDRHEPGNKQIVRFTVQFTPVGPQVAAAVKEEGCDFIPISIANLPPFSLSTGRAEVLATLQQSAVASLEGKIHFLPDPVTLYREWETEFANRAVKPHQRQQLEHRITQIAHEIRVLERFLLLEARSNWLKKLPLIHHLISILERWVMLPAMAQSYEQLGFKYEDLSLHQSALLCFQKIITLASQVNDIDIESRAYCNLGNAYNHLGEYKHALDCYMKFLDLAKKMGNLGNQCSAYSNLGSVYQRLGDYGESIKLLEVSLKIATETNNLENQGSAYTKLGNGYLYLGDYRKAIEFYGKKIEIAILTDNEKGLGIAYSNIGCAHLSLGECELAIGYFELSLEIAQKTANLQSQGKAYNNLGNAYSRLGEYTRAVEFYKKKLEIANETGDLVGQYKVSINLAHTYYHLREDANALVLYENSLAASKQSGDARAEGTVYKGLGDLYLSDGKYEKAIDFYEKSLKLAKQIKNQEGEGNAYNGLGLAQLRLRNYGEAIKYHEQHLKIANATNDLIGQFTAHLNLGNAYRGDKNYSMAQAAYQNSIDICNRLQKENTERNMQTDIAFFQILFTPFLALAELLVKGLVTSLKVNPIHEALRLVDSARSRALVGVLAKETGGVQEPLSVEQMLSIAAQHQTTFLLYSCSPSKETEALVWVIPPKGEITYRFLDLTPMKEEMNTKDNRPKHLQSVRGNRDHGFVEVADWVTRSPWVPAKADVIKKSKVVQLWYQCLIDPIKDKLPQEEGARVTIIPDPTMGDLPFLIFKGETGEILLEPYTISTIPSIQALAQLGANDLKKASNRNLDEACIVANPAGSGLGGAEREGKAVAMHFKNPKLFIGNAATLTNVKQALPKAGFIHLACHGQSEDQDGNPVKQNIHSVFQGRFLLTDSNLYSEDLMNPPLNAKLAVLSACHSGTGSLSKEGVVGPMHALLAAGVSTVVGTRWAIDDQATRLIIEKFYYFYFSETPESQKAQEKGRPFGAAEALREALLFAKQEAAKGNLQSPDPYDPDFTAAWGAFFLVGLPGK